MCDAWQHTPAVQCDVPLGCYLKRYNNTQGIHLARKLGSQAAWLDGKACTSKDIVLKNSP